MNDKKTDILKNIYDELHKIKNEENEIIQNNLNRMKEIDVFLDSLKEDTDFSFFHREKQKLFMRIKLKY